MTTRELRTLPLRQIDCERQVRERFNEDGLAGLAQSLASVGLQQPILVRAVGDRFVVIDGERRFRAAALEGWETIQALVEEGSSSEPERIVRQLVANCQREDLTPIETARAIESLMRETGCTATEAAARTGVKAAKVSKLLALLSLPEPIQDQVHARTLAASTAYEISKAKDPEERAELIADATKGGLKRDVAAKRSRASKKPQRSARDLSPGRHGKGGARGLRRTIPVGPGCAIVITSGKVSVAGLIEALEQTCTRLRALEVNGDLSAEAVASSLDLGAAASAQAADAKRSTPRAAKVPSSASGES